MKLRTALLLFCTGCALQHAAGNRPADNGQRPLAETQTALLDEAFVAVSKMPSNPHIKNRSRAQYQVVAALLELGQPQQAAQRLGKIDDWQRCLALLDTAFFHAENNQPGLADEHLKPALEMIRMADDIQRGRVVAASSDPVIDTLTDWRLEQVRVRLFQVETALGREVADGEGIKNLRPANAAAVAACRIANDPAASFAEQLVGLAQLATNQDFEVVQQALNGGIQLMDRHYGDAARRKAASGFVDANVDRRLPVFVQIDLRIRQAETALAHDDLQAAQESIVAAAAVAEQLGESRWALPQQAKLAVLRHRAGDAVQAETDLAKLVQWFDAQRALIVDIDRAGLLCSLAEAYAQTGRRDEALALYARAVAEGQANPNSRPRADDLSAICRSMALNAVEPTAALVAALDEMNRELGTPW